MALNVSKTLKILGLVVLPQTRPSSFHGVEELFVWNFMQPFRKHSSWKVGRSPTSFVTAQLISRRRKFFSFWCYADYQQRSNERLVVLPQTRSNSFLGVESTFRPDGVKPFKNILFIGCVVLPQTRASSFHGVEQPFRLDVMQPFQKLSSWWLGRAPQHPLSRPSSFHGAKLGYRFDVMQTFNNVQMNGWSCSPKHGPAEFTVLSQLFVRMAWSFSKTIESLAGSCSPKHAPILFTVLKNLFVWMLCSHSKTFKLMAGPRSPTSPVTAQLVLRHSTGLFFCCDADFQQRSNERLVVLPQTRSSSIHAVDSTFRPDGVKLFKNNQNLGWIVLPRTRPSFFYGVEEPFRLHVMQPLRKHSSWWLGRVPKHPQSRPSSFHGVKPGYRFDVVQTFNSVKWTAGRAPPNTVQLISLCLVNFSLLWREAFQKYSKLRLGRAPPNTAQFLPRCWRTFSSEYYAATSKTIKLVAGPRFPTCFVTAQFISRRRRFFSFWCYADFQQRLNEWLVVLPQIRSSTIHGVESTFRPDGVKLFKTFDFLAGSCFPKHGPIQLTVLQNFFVWMLCSNFKNIQVNGWAALPNIPYHGPAHFTALNMGIALMLCRLSTTFKWTAGCAPPNTVQLKSRCWINFSSGWCEAFQKHSKLRLDRAPPITAQLLSRCWRTFSSGCYAAISKTFKLMAGPRSPTSPVTAQLISRR